MCIWLHASLHRIKCECCRWALGGDYDVDSLHSSVAAAKRTWKICACRYGDAIHVCCAAAAHRHCTVTFKVMSILIKGCVRHTEQMQYLHKMHFAFNQFKCGFECIAFINELYIWLNRGRVCVDSFNTVFVFHSAWICIKHLHDITATSRCSALHASKQRCSSDTSTLHSALLNEYKKKINRNCVTDWIANIRVGEQINVAEWIKSILKP